MPVPTRSPLMQRLLFALNFFRHPFMLGSIWPSSRYLVDEVLRPIEWERAMVIVEYGPGVGTITTEILGRIQPIEGLVVEPGRGHVTHVLLQEGHLWGRKDVAIPIGAVELMADGITVAMTKHQIGELPALDLSKSVP